MFFGDAIVINAYISALIVVFIYFLDRAEKEPPFFLCTVYLTVIAGTFAFVYCKSLLWQMVGGNSVLLGVFFRSFLEAGLAEQGLKFMLFMVLVWNSENFNEEMDGIVYCMVIASGFAVVENIGYTMKATIPAYLYGRSQGDFSFYYQSLIHILQVRYYCGHILMDTVMGFFIGRAKFSAGKTYLAWVGFIVSVCLHGFWNYLAETAPEWFFWYLAGMVLMAVFLVFITLRNTRYERMHRELIHLLQSLDLSGCPKLFSQVRRARNRLVKNLRGMGYLESDEQDGLAQEIRENLSESEIAGLSEKSLLLRLRKLNKNFSARKRKMIVVAGILYFVIMFPSTLLIYLLY